MGMNWEPTVSIVIPCFNVEHIVNRCIQGILSQDYPQEKLKIIIVDDGSKDNTSTILQQYVNNDKITVIQHLKNRSLAAARNTGIKSSDSEVIGFIDSDIVVQKEWLQEILSILQDDKIIGCMGDTRLPSELTPNQLDKFMYHPKRGARKFGENVPMEFPWFLFNNTMIKRSALNSVGYFDESFEGYGGEDTDLAIRLFDRFKTGLRFNARAIGDHFHQRNLEQLKIVLKRYGSTNYLTLLNRYPAVQIRITTATGWIRYNRVFSHI